MTIFEIYLCAGWTTFLVLPIDLIGDMVEEEFGAESPFAIFISVLLVWGFIALFWPLFIYKAFWRGEGGK